MVSQSLACVFEHAILSAGFERADGTDSLERVKEPSAARPGTSSDSRPGGLGELGAEIKHRLPPLKALTSLRFFAAMHVVVYHLSAGHIYSQAPLPGRFIGSGYTGVSLFFILSGFILAYNYREGLNKREFWISRFARVYPVYLVALLLGLAYSFAPASGSDGHHLWLQFGLTATLLQSWYQPFAESFNGPGWTLSVEALFYAVFPFVLGWMRRVNKGLFLVLCAVYASVLFVPLLWSYLAAGSRWPLAVAHFMTWSRLPPMHLPLFVIGTWLGIAYRTKAAAGRSRWPLWLGGTAGLVLLCLAPSELQEPARRGLLAISYGSLIYGLASVRDGWLTNRWMVLGGEISYSIYILQMPVMRTVLGVTRRFGVGYYGGVAAVVLTLIPLSFLAYRFVELPARLAIRNRFTRIPVALEKI